MAVELTPGRLFEIVLEEALRDGKVEEDEFEKVEAVKKLLGITQEQHQAAFRKVKARIDAAEPRDRSLDRLLIYRKCLVVAAADGDVTDVEKEHLRTIQRFLAITPEEHRESMEKVKAWLARKRSGEQSSGKE